MFSDADGAELYDLLNPWDPGLSPGDRFYHELVMTADPVLDVGCGTGAMLACARDHGHCGRLTGHAFQCLVTDHDLSASLAAIHAALREGGRFAFETRHPQARAWHDWNPSNGADITGPNGRPLRVWHEVESADGDLVTFTGTTAQPDGTVLHTSRTTLRFLDPPALSAFLDAAGFQIEAQYGDWDRTPITTASREIITITRE